MHSYILLLFSWLFLIPVTKVSIEPDYAFYHIQILNAEQKIASENFKEALIIYESLFNEYDFVFLRDYQRATQLAFILGNNKKTQDLLGSAIESGWSLKSIKRNKFLAEFRKTDNWKSLKKDYDSLRNQYEKRLNLPLREQVKKMFSKDQGKALGALFTFSSKAQDRYAESKFAPHSIDQMHEFEEIMDSYGYPGEMLIGNSIWMSTILSHHNSISQEFVKRDTLYPSLRPHLIRSLKNGQISPFELALIDDWYLAVKSGRTAVGYGILNSPDKESLKATNELREKIHMRPIELRNCLVEIENETGMDFYLQGEPWIEGKIEMPQDTE